MKLKFLIALKHRQEIAFEQLKFFAPGLREIRHKVEWITTWNKKCFESIIVYFRNVFDFKNCAINIQSKFFFKVQRRISFVYSTVSEQISFMLEAFLFCLRIWDNSDFKKASAKIRQNLFSRLSVVGWKKMNINKRPWRTFSSLSFFPEIV